MRAIFSAPVQTGPVAQPASYTMGTGSFQGARRPGRGVDHPPPSSDEVNERVQLYLYSISGPSLPVIGRILHLLYQLNGGKWSVLHTDRFTHGAGLQCRPGSPEETENLLL